MKTPQVPALPGMTPLGLPESPMTVRFLFTAEGGHAIIRTAERSMTVRLSSEVPNEVSLQQTADELRAKAATILARADFIERASRVLIEQTAEAALNDFNYVGSRHHY